MSDDEPPVPKRISIDKDLVEPELPASLFTRPPVPDGLGKGWFLERPGMFLFARVLSNHETIELQNKIYSKAGDGVRHRGDYVATVLELVVQNTSLEPIKRDSAKAFQLSVLPYNDLQCPVKPVNYSAFNAAKDLLGPDHSVTKALDEDARNLVITPRSRLVQLHYFTNYGRTRSLLPELIFRVYAGEWPLWPTHVSSPPPGYRAPAEGVVKLYVHRSSREGDDKPEPETVPKGLRLEAKTDWDTKVEFISEHPVVVSETEEAGFARVLATVPGDDGILGAGAIDTVSTYGASITSVTNPLPTWEPWRGPPPGPYPCSTARRRWLMTLGAQRPLVAAEGESFAAAVENHMWVFHPRGEVRYAFDTSWYPYSLCFGKGARSVYMGHDNTLVEFDLERGKGYDLQDLPNRIENIAVMPDGSLMVLSDSGLLMHVDTDGRALKSIATKGSARVFCAKDTVAVWDGYAKLQVLDGRLKEVVCLEQETFDGVALSPDGRYLAVGSANQGVSVLDIRDAARPVAKWRTIGLAHALAFHPRRPLLVVGTRDSYLQTFHLESGPLFSRRVEGYVANEIAYGEKACIMSMVDGYIHVMEFEEE